MTAYQLADPPSPETVEWALRVANQAEIVKLADENAVAARSALDYLLSQKPSE